MYSTNQVASLAALAAIVAASGNTAEARRYGSILMPSSRRYQYNRDSFDLMSGIISTPIFSDLGAMANSILNQHHRAAAESLSQAEPRYHVTEDGNVLELSIELPGVAAKDVTVEVENSSLLRVHGTRKYIQHGQVTTSDFDQAFQISQEADIDKIAVTLSHGILTVRAPRKQKHVLRLEIGSETSEQNVEHIENARQSDDDLHAEPAGTEVSPEMSD